MKRKLCIVMAIGALLTLAAAPAWATSFYWTGADGNWNNASGWGGTVPATNGGTTTQYDHKLYINANLTYSATQGYTTFNNAGFDTIIATNADANLTIASGATWDSRTSGSTNSHGTAIGNTGDGALTVYGTYNNTVDATMRALFVNSGNDSGTLNVETGGVCTAGDLRLSGRTSSSGGAATVNLNGGVLSVGDVSTSYDGGTSYTSANRTFNFNGGTLKALQSLTMSMTGGASGTNLVNVKSGGAVIDTQSYDVTISKDLLEDSGSTGGGLSKQGTGTLTLGGTNTYTGDTTVSAGTLSLSNLGLADASTVSIASGAYLNLGFTGSDTIGALCLNGAKQADGVYNYTNCSYLTGTSGSLTVSSVPEPNAIVLLLSGILGLIAYAWRKRK